MDVMVLGKSGIGTSKAVIKIKLTRDNASEFCELYLGDTTSRCIRKVLKEDGSRLRPTVSGNCETRTWIDMYGNSFILKGRSKKSSDEWAAEYIVQNRKTGKVLDDSMVSGYAVAMGVLGALCPNFSAPAKSDNVETDSPKENGENTSIARALTEAEEAQFSEMLKTLPVSTELELTAGHLEKKNWDQCLLSFEGNIIGYGEDGYKVVAQLINEPNKIAYQSLASDTGTSFIEARCASDTYIMSVFTVKKTSE